MWATLRPITNNTKLVTKVVSKVVDYELPCFHNHDEYKIFMTQIRKFILSITSDNYIFNRNKLDSGAEMVAYAWFEYAISCIIENITRRPRFVKSHGEHLIVSGADMVWSINKLSSITWFQALGYSFHEVVDEHSKSWISRVDMEAVLFPSLRELGESSVKKFSRNCSRWNSNRQIGISESCSFSCEGVLVLFNWIRRILSLTMNNANVRCTAGNRNISCRNMIWAFNWTRLNHFDEKPNLAYSKQGKRNIKKRHAAADEPLSCLPPDILISHILPKLPWDSLSRFKCVSRYWKETISSAYFQRLLGEQDHQTHSFCNFDEFPEELMEFKHECNGVELLILNTTSPTKECNSSFYASCSGFLCLRLYIRGRYSIELVVGNPLTGDWSHIPSLPLYGFKLWRGPGLAVDITSDPSWYKLVILSSFRKEYFFYVFSSKTGEWKASNAVVPKFGMDKADAHILKGDSVYINGLLYWVCVTCKLLWFDLEKDEVGHADLPCSYERSLSYALGSLESPDGRQRQLTYTVFLNNKRLETYKLAGKDQWIKLLSIPVRCWSYVRLFPYMGGEHQFVWQNGKIVACRIGTRERKVVGDGPFCPIAFQLNVAPLPKVLNKV